MSEDIGLKRLLLKESSLNPDFAKNEIKKHSLFIDIREALALSLVRIGILETCYEPEFQNENSKNPSADTDG